MSSSPFQTVTIAGGTGNVGYSVSEAFLNDGSYNIKILRKKPENENEKAKLLASKGAEIVYADYNQKDELVNALKGTDVLISAIYSEGSTFYDSQISLLVAAKEASVKRFIPSEFAMGFKNAVHETYVDKIRLREEIEKSGLEYTYFNNGVIQELLFGWFAFDVKNKKATFYGDGNTKIPSTSLSDVGKYVVETLKIPESRNAYILVAGVNLSLNEYLQEFEKVSDSKWELVEDKDVQHRFKNKIDPIPDSAAYFKAIITENSKFSEDDFDNDKFSITPTPITKAIETIVKRA